MVNQLPSNTPAHCGIRFDLALREINDFFNNTDQDAIIGLAFIYKSQVNFSIRFGAGAFFET